MVPLLAQIGGLRIYTYGVFLMLGFFWACFYVWKHVRISKFAEEETFDIIFASFGGALVLGRLVYGILHFSEFGFDILHYLLVNGYPGISAVGMLAGGALTLFLVCMRKKINVAEFIDYVIPALFLFVAIAELGAFFAGIEPGLKMGWFRHPIALYRTVLFGLGVYLSTLLLYAVRKDKQSKGVSGVFFVWFYALATVGMTRLMDARVVLTSSVFEYWTFMILLLTSSFYIVYYFRVFIGTMFRSFINWNATYVKTVVRIIPQKSESKDRGRDEKSKPADRKP
jgi:phosphatidylglycerol:prolipoprotein diacylglycerol transferase